MALACKGFTPRSVRVEPAGLWYEVRVVRDLLCLGLSTAPIYHHVPSVIDAADDSDENCDDSDLLICDDGEEYEQYLTQLDPNETKDQDHYKVLGLYQLRWKATEDQIRTAYRRKVLKHHPDKRRARGIAVLSENEDYFTCITKAYEQLSNADKRRAYDSCDPLFDESIPSANSITRENFFDVVPRYFELNERWSVNQPVPNIGDDSMSKERVDSFYSFWFDFKSWREFSYLDEEDKEKGLLMVDEMRVRMEKKTAELHLQTSRAKSDVSNKSGGAVWTADENQLLVKATTLFPVGTKSRWEVIAEFINEHAKEGDRKRKTARDVINRVKDFQSMDSSTKEATTKEGAFNNFIGGKKSGDGVPNCEAVPSERFDVDRPWSADEQKLLEQALRTYPASTADRWDRIAECIPERSKKDCIKRFKELAELIKAKKAAQQNVAAKR